MIGNKRFDCEEMFMHACTFCECADLAKGKEKHDTAIIGFYCVPAVVNSAFACEVFLKTILKLYDIKSPRSHKLKDLFESTPEKVQEYVKNTVNRNYGGMWYSPMGFEHLEVLSNAFQEWRYIYEWDLNKGGIQIEFSFIYVFRNALRDLCCQIQFRKTWEEYSKGEK